MASINPPPGSWIPPFLSRYANPAPALPSSSTTATANTTTLSPRDPNAPAPNSIYTPRGRRQASIFLAGLISVVWAGSMTRRSLTKRRAPLPAAVLQAATPQTTTMSMGQGAQAARSIAQQAGGTGTLAAPAAASEAVVAGTTGKGIMAETLQAYRGGVRQTSPGTSVGSVGGGAVAAVEGGAARSVGEAVSHGVQPGGAAASAAAEEAAAAELNASGPILAVEALFLATANVLSWALLVTGGALWYADISSVEEMRRAVRGGLGVDGTGRTEQEAEEEMEEWFAKVLKRGEEKAETARVDERGRAR